MAWGESRVFTLCKHNWILLINRALFVVVVVFNLIFPLFLFLFISHYFKKVSMDPVHDRGSMDPWSMFCPHPHVITLYAHRNHQLLLARFFSAKLRKHQVTWLPCEVEALAIASSEVYHLGIKTKTNMTIVLFFSLSPTANCPCECDGKS